MLPFEKAVFAYFGCDDEVLSMELEGWHEKMWGKLRCLFNHDVIRRYLYLSDKLDLYMCYDS